MPPQDKNKKRNEVYVVIGGGQPRSGNIKELRAEVGACEDYSRFNGVSKGTGGSERDYGSMSVDEESQSGYPRHGYMPCAQDFDNDSVDLRARRSVGSSMIEQPHDEFEEEEDLDEQEDTLEAEDEQTFSQTEYTNASIVNGTMKSNNTNGIFLCRHILSLFVQ